MIELISLELIEDNPYQPRMVDDPEHIEKLARSIAADDLLQTPKARRCSDGTYQLAFGHSRRKAFEWLRDFEGAIEPNRYDGYSMMPLEIVDLTDEEMYRHAVTENVQRRDLAPTELARSMKRYMDEFNANSQQTALLFGMSDSTVRGMVRLLDLPEDIRAALDEGKISQGTARTFLSLQKVAPAKEMNAILGRIHRNEGNALPDAVIEDSVEKLHNVEKMWDSDRKDGKPRSHWNNGWLLDMKNFPNKLLAEVDPGDVVDALQMDIDSPIVKKIFAAFEKYADENPEGTYREVSFDGVDVPAQHIERVKVLIDPPACTSCPFYTRIRGVHFCGMKVCHERKTRAWKQSIIEQASKNLKISIYDKTDGRFVKLVGYEDKHKKLFDKRDPSLRLISKELAGDGYAYQGSFKGVEDSVFVVVATGDAIEKLAKAGSKVGGKKTEKEKAEMRAMKLFRTRRKELMWEYVKVAQGIFESVPGSALEILDRWKYVGIDDRIPNEYLPGKDTTPEESCEFKRRQLVWTLIHEQCSYYRRESLLDILEKFTDITGVRAPKGLINKVTQWDEEIDTVAKPVSVETPSRKGKK